MTLLEKSQKLGNEDSGVGIHLKYVVIQPSAHCCVETKEWHLVVIHGCTRLCQLEMLCRFERNVNLWHTDAAPGSVLLEHSCKPNIEKVYKIPLMLNSYSELLLFRGEVSEIENTKLQPFFDFNRFCKLKIECRPEITKKITGFLILLAWCPMSTDGRGHLLFIGVSTALI